MREHPNVQAIGHNMPHMAFCDLDLKTQKLILKLMARVAERSYRRGAQQGAHLALTAPHVLPRNLGSWRYGASLDKSPWLDDPGRSDTSLERLMMECPGIMQLGLIP